ncbi:Aggrecan core [Gossypium australe]|uniref:Aggrecan core n=1 Tax=Gossypium australe TaxID=47621 RepID=A0A5B6WTU5_9ROSI|nr:Aggrecan core [Gossypium australe]
MLFISTLKALFINHMLKSATKSFSDIVTFGEMIENVIRSLDINNMGNTTNDSKPLFKQKVCPEEPQDFKVDQDCRLFPDLLRMVEQDEKQIPPYKESVESMAFLYVGHGYQLEQVEVTSLISLKLQWSRLKIAESYFPEVAVEHIEAIITDLISLNYKSYLSKVEVEQVEFTNPYLPEVAVEQIEHSESYFPEVAVEQIKATSHKSYTSEVAVGRIKSTKTELYLPEVAGEQIEATNLISLKWIESLIPMPLKMKWD